MKLERPAVGSALLVAGAVMAMHAFYELALWRSRGPQDVDGEFFFDTSHSSPGLILGVAALYLYIRRYRIRAGLAEPGSWLLGLLFLVPAASLYGWSVHTGAIDLRTVSLMLFLTGAASLLGGAPLVKAVRAPVLFLLLILPLPPVVMNEFVYAMQGWSLLFASWLVELMGLEVFSSGDMMFVGSRGFEVIETCSGTRALATLIMSAFVYAEIFGCQGWRMALLVAVAPPISFVINGLRILSIILSADSGFAQDHTIQGVVALVFGVLALHAVNSAAERFFPKSPLRAEVVPTAESHPFSQGLIVRAGVVVGVLAVMSSVQLWGPRWEAPPKLGHWPVVMPKDLGPWSGRAIDVDRTFLGSVGFSRHMLRSYTRSNDPDARIRVFVAYHDRVSRSTSLLSPKVALPGAGYQLIDQWQISLGDDLPDVLALRSHFREHVFLSYSWYTGIESYRDEVLRFVTAADNSSYRRVPGVMAVRIVTEVANTPEGPEQAEQRFREFLTLLLPTLNARPERI